MSKFFTKLFGSPLDKFVSKLPLFTNEDVEKIKLYLASKPQETTKAKNSVIDSFNKHINFLNYKTDGKRYVDMAIGLFGSSGLENQIKALEVETFIHDRIKDDDALDPNELNDIVRFSKEVGCEEYDELEKIRKVWDFYITNWELDKGVFKGIETDFLLQKNELCIFSLNNCEAVQRKKILKRVQHGGLSYRTKVLGPISYRAGSTSISLHSETTDINKGSGDICVTNKRILFKGADGIMAITKNSIADIEMYANAVMYNKANESSVYFNTNRAAELYKYSLAALRN